MNLVITGTSSGIGRSLATHLLAQGHQIFGLARSDQSAFARAHPNFRAAVCDVAVWEQMERTAEEIARTWSQVDGLIACAGVQGEIGPAMAVEPRAWSATVRTNLEGAYYAIRALYALLEKAPRRAKVVCFSGGGATKPRVNFSAYGVAKTGIVRLVETLAEELRDRPIDLNSIAPGAINTRLTEEVLQLGPAVVGQTEYDAALKQKASGGASLAKALGLIDFLLSPASDGISGRLIAAPWDPWPTLGDHRDALARSDIYTLRRIVPEERAQSLG